MTRRSVEPTRRFHLFLYKRDLDYLERRFGAGAPSSQRLGVGTACREIIHDRVKKLRARENERLNAIIDRDTETEQEAAEARHFMYESEDADAVNETKPAPAQ